MCLYMNLLCVCVPITSWEFNIADNLKEAYVHKSTVSNQAISLLYKNNLGTTYIHLSHIVASSVVILPLFTKLEGQGVCIS